MRVVFSSNSSWSVFNFRLNLLLKLKAVGHEIIVVAPDSKYASKLRELGFATMPIEVNGASTKLLDNITLFISLFKLYKSIKPDVVLHNAVKPNIYGALCCRILKIPAINNISGLGTIFLTNNLSSLVGKKLYNLSHRKVNTIFFQNPTDLSFFIQNDLVKPEQCVLIPGSGVDLKRFKPANYKKNIVITKFCFVGRLIRDKGIIEYTEAIQIIKKKYTNCEFYVLGELYPQNPTAVTKATLNEWISGGLLTFLGKSDHVERELIKFDCVVLPSYREGLSRVLLEASAMEIPCITTNVPGCSDVIKHGFNGYLCKAKDSNDLARQMEDFINLSQNERAAMGKNGRKLVVEKFDEEFVIKSYIDELNKIQQSFQ